MIRKLKEMGWREALKIAFGALALFAACWGLLLLAWAATLPEVPL